MFVLSYSLPGSLSLTPYIRQLVSKLGRNCELEVSLGKCGAYGAEFLVPFRLILRGVSAKCLRASCFFNEIAKQGRP